MSAANLPEQSSICNFALVHGYVRRLASCEYMLHVVFVLWRLNMTAVLRTEFSRKLTPATFTCGDRVHEFTLSRLNKQSTEQVWFRGSAELM